MRGGTLGWFLCWAVVFADIGTSVYYTPGILYGPFGTRAALFVTMTLVVFVLLTIKYTEVTWRFPEGGGVVNVASHAFHPYVGLLGGLFIMVDYFLTAAISTVSGFQYLSVVLPKMSPVVLPLTVIALLALGTLNALGIKESARVNATFAIAAAAGQFAVVGATAIFLGYEGIVHSFQRMFSGPALTPIFLITGYGAAFLAFSGLETIAQLAPAMREPRIRVAQQATGAVILTMALTSPLLTLWSTTLLGPESDPSQFISLLGGHVARGGMGTVLQTYVALSASLLLIFASNTAIIGSYHVFIALSRMGFLPRALERRNRWRNTPHWAIAMAIGVPILVVVATAANVNLLGDLYAFGLLGAFVLTCLSLDVVRLQERVYRRSLGSFAMFVIGLLTTLAVLVAWLTNLVAKPAATLFGGGLTIFGLIIGLATVYYKRSREPVVFPLLHRAVALSAGTPAARELGHAQVMAILPQDPEAAEAVVKAVTESAVDGPVVFMYRGTELRRPSQLMEVNDPYLNDRAAQVAFSRAERASRRKVKERRYVYVRAGTREDAVGDVWRTVAPHDTIVLDGDQRGLPAVALDRVRRSQVDGFTVLHLLSSKRRPEASPANA